jgi:hypothetical protein
MSGSRQTGKFLLLLCLAVVVFYVPILIGDQFSILTGFDAATMDYSWYNYTASSLKQGRVPLWDPYTQGGRSFVGESATGGFSPLRLTWIWVLSKDGVLSPKSMQVVYVLLHALAAVLMFALARTLGLSPFGSLLSGLTFTLAGFTGRAGWFDMLESTVWLPLIFLFQIKALQANDNRLRFSFALYAAAALGMVALGGRVHILIMDALLVIAAAVFFAIRMARDPVDSARRGNRWLSSGLLVAIIGIAGFAAAAVQLLPSMEYAPEANRWIRPDMSVPAASRIPYAYLRDGFSPRALVGFLFPFIDVGTADGFSPYFGILPFFLSLIGVRNNWRNGWVRFLAGAATVSFFYSLGWLSFLHRLAYFLVPFLWIERQASRFIYLTHFAGVILAGFGADTLLSRAGQNLSPAGFMKILRWCVIGITAVVVTLVLLRRPEANDWIALSFLFLVAGYLLLAAIDRGYRTPGASFLLVAITLCDVGAYDWDILNVTEVRATGIDHLERLMSVRPVVSFLKSQQGLFRVHVEAKDQPNIGDAYQVQTTDGVAATALKSFDRLINKCGRLDLLNVRYLLRESKAPGEPVYEAGGWKLVENPSGYSRAWLVHDAVVQPSEEEIFRRVCARDFDPRQTALLDAPLETPLEAGSTGNSGQVAVRSYEADRMELETQSEVRGLLVLSEMYYPGWRAEVNGAAAEIHKVDGALRGIVVPAGVSRVVLRYAPRSIAAGAALSLLTFIGTLLLAVFNWAKSRTARHRQATGEDS